ncbi:MarR family winged helix-turn-helix transcriptional regulator [Actinomycetospora succinea]|uniref:MarR family winged helix-turn-helix transcriptional regulator n=1 Tax=Actinomycetospora succinea TaxID=663603 RepID=UPI001414F61C|nr:MarR family transcriptional regulator [Actinomycetospora succinea]
MSDDAIREEPALAALDDTTLAVRRLISASQDLTVRTARRLAMNVSDMTAIMQLSEHGPMGVAELARRLGVSSPATSVLVDRLEKAGHVARVRDTLDRRRVRITDTPAGRAATLAAWLPAIEEIDEVSRSLSASERDVARDLLDRLTRAMARRAEA